MSGRIIDPVKAEKARVKLRKLKAVRDNARHAVDRAQDKLYSEVYKASAAGVTYVQIAQDLGISEVYVYKILKEQKELRSA